MNHAFRDNVHETRKLADVLWKFTEVGVREGRRGKRIYSPPTLSLDSYLNRWYNGEFDLAGSSDLAYTVANLADYILENHRCAPKYRVILTKLRDTADDKTDVLRNREYGRMNQR